MTQNYRLFTGFIGLARRPAGFILGKLRNPSKIPEFTVSSVVAACCGPLPPILSLGAPDARAMNSLIDGRPMVDLLVADYILKSSQCSATSVTSSLSG